MDYLPFVKAIALGVHANLPVHVELDDLVHAGILGLIDAASKYNPATNVAFSSYAKHRIKGAMLDSLRQMDWASRDLRRRQKQAEKITRDFATTLQRNPTEAELAEKLGMDVARWRLIVLDLRNGAPVSASLRVDSELNPPAPDYPSKPETQPDRMCARQELSSVLVDSMKELPERYREVLLLYYTEERTMKEIGSVLGVNESRVSQIHKLALARMAVVLESKGVHSSQAFGDVH